MRDVNKKACVFVSKGLIALRGRTAVAGKTSTRCDSFSVKSILHWDDAIAQVPRMTDSITPLHSPPALSSSRGKDERGRCAGKGLIVVFHDRGVSGDLSKGLSPILEGGATPPLRMNYNIPF